MPQDEQFSWRKLGKGPFVGKNYAKAAVLTLCQVIIVALIGGLVFTVLTLRGKQSHKSATEIKDNSGTFEQYDSHAQVTENHWHLPLSDVLNWFNWTDKKTTPRKENK